MRTCRSTMQEFFSHVQNKSHIAGARLFTEQIYTWLREDPVFKVKLEMMRTELVTRAFSEAVEKLKISMTTAVDTLVSLLEREDYPNVQRAAANDVLSHIQKFKEIQELEERIAKLERQSIT